MSGSCDLQEDVLPRVLRLIRIVRNVFNQEALLHRFQKVHVGASSPLEAEVAHRIRTNEILERLLEQFKGGLEIYAVCSQHNVGVLWDGIWRRSAPLVDGGFHTVAEVIQRDILFHQSEHRVHIGDVNSSTRLTSHGHGQPTAVNTRDPAQRDYM